MTDLTIPTDEPVVDLGRRSILRAGICAGMLSAMPGLAIAEPGFWDQPRKLKLYRPQTKEYIEPVYWQNGQLNYEGYYQACQLLRDVHDKQAVQMDVVLLDILRGVQGYYQAYGFDYPLYVNSGFRTLKTNSALLTEGAAKNSMHLYGRAADIHIPNVPVKHLGAVGLYFRRGGVGFYDAKDFVHLDTGNLRVWRG